MPEVKVEFMLVTTQNQGHHGGQPQHHAGPDLLQDGRADEAAEHGAAPVAHQELGGDVLAQAGDGRQTHVVDQQ